jgi:hypothetical protein
MTKSELQALAAECFAGNPNLKKAYQTQDGVCFAQRNDAIMHKRGCGFSEDVEEVFPDAVGNEKEVAGAAAEAVAPVKAAAAVAPVKAPVAPAKKK